MAEISSMCVYCGSRDGKGLGYAKLAREVGKMMAENDIKLVYGGGSVGTMGHIARAVLGAGGHVTGVIPSSLDSREITFEQCSELHVVGNMHERKKMMFDLADAFLVLPGGIGTLEEMVEVMTWRQLRMHEKPIIVLNAVGYWTPFLQLLNQMIDQEFANGDVNYLYSLVETIDEIMPVLDEADDPWLESESNLF